MKKPVYSDRAKSDLSVIAEYYDQFNDTAAPRIIRAILNRCLSVASQPRIGRSREELAVELRSIPAGDYVIYFRKIPRHVEIVRVLHGARDNSFQDFEPNS